MGYGTNIKKIREKKGIKSCYVAKKLGIARSRYSQIENDKAPLSLQMAERIAEILNVDLNEFLNKQYA
jgi:transcriptional regulator with XRE-family HTH domain